jgi:hypothetical protein
VRRDLEDGTVRLEATLHPEEAALVWAMLDRAATQATAKERGFSRADALVALAQAYLRGDRPERSPVELTVVVSAETLSAGSAETASAGATATAACGDGTCVSAETARRLACDAGIVRVVEGAEGTPLSVGRKTRSIPSSIKRALLRRDTACRFPGCTNRMFLEGHHIQHWADGGETKIGNIAISCSHHHRFVHEYGYRMAQSWPSMTIGGGASAR